MNDLLWGGFKVLACVILLAIGGVHAAEHEPSLSYRLEWPAGWIVQSVERGEQAYFQRVGLPRGARGHRNVDK